MAFANSSSKSIAPGRRHLKFYISRHRLSCPEEASMVIKLMRTLDSTNIKSEVVCTFARLSNIAYVFRL